MSETKLTKDNLNPNTITTSDIQPNGVTAAKIGTDISNADISTSAAITISKLSTPGSGSTFLKGNNTFAAIDIAQSETNLFNVGLLGFKMAVNDGLTIFNLKDGVVDEFNSEDGIDTAENTNATYDSTEDFYTNDSTAPSPATTNIQAFWHNDGTFNDNESTDGGGTNNNEVSPFTYTAPPTAKAVDLLVIGGGGAGGLGVTGSMVGSGGGGGAGGLVYI